MSFATVKLQTKKERSVVVQAKQVGLLKKEIMLLSQSLVLMSLAIQRTQILQQHIRFDIEIDQLIRGQEITNLNEINH